MRPSNFHAWGKTKYQKGHRVRFDGSKELINIVRKAETSLLPTGSLRSYHDTALNNSGSVIDATSLKGLTLLKSENAVIAGAGVTITELQTFLIEHGYSLWVQPGTGFVTVGGAIAADIHGKSHHLYGTFSKHVQNFEILLSSGEVKNLFPEGETREFFWATVGGLGLTGIILSAKLSIRSISANVIKVHEFRSNDLNETMDILRVQSPSNEESVAWIDIGKKGKGRGLISFGNLATQNASLKKPLNKKFHPGGLSVPTLLGKGVINNLTIRSFNSVWFYKNLKNGLSDLQSFHAPLDALGSWNNLYGKKGLIQYQFVIPFSQESFLDYFLSAIAKFGGESPLCVLKTFGESGEGLLSFPTKGWTLAADFPYSLQLVHLLEALTLELVEAGGRTYFPKDLTTQPDLVERMYPKLRHWREVQLRMDPERKWMSDQAVRLRLL